MILLRAKATCCRELTYEVSYSNGQFKTYQLSGAQKTEFVDTLGMLHAMFGKGDWHGGKFLTFPLFQGKKWDLEYSAPLVGIEDKYRRRWNVEVTVTRVEEIEISWNKFQVFRITNKQASGRIPMTITYYYSPETKSIVKLSFAGKTGSGTGGKADIELLAFGSAKTTN